MSPRIPICAVIAGLSLSACASASTNLPRDALVEIRSASGLVMNDAPTARSLDGVAEHMATLAQG